MLKQIITLASFAVGITVNAQGIYQFTDPGFEDWTSNNVPGHEWHSFESAIGSYSTYKNSSPKPFQETENPKEGTKSLGIYSKKVVSPYANGNLTTGVINMGNMTPSNSSNYNTTKRGQKGQFLEFEGTPDAVSFDARFTSGGSANGRGRFILHGDVDYRDPELKDKEGNLIQTGLIGEAIILVPPTTDWVHYQSDFSYKVNTKPTKQYLLASLTTNPIAGGSKDDYLYVDNIQFIYYNTLKSLSYDGTTIDFKEETTSYDLSSITYEAAKLHYEVKGKGATSSIDYNKATGVVTITAKGNDITENAANKTVYTIQFAPEKQGEVTKYTNDLSVGLTPSGEDAVPSTTSPEKNTINLIKETDNSISLELKNFVLSGELPIGNIKVTNLNKNGNSYTASQSIIITAGDDPQYDFWMGPDLGPVNVNVNATVNEDQMVAQISIKGFDGFESIDVTFAPTTKFAEGQSIETTAGVKNIVMHRTFKKGWNTVCLPFSTTATNLQKDNGCVVQEFTSANEKGLTFKKVADGVIEANKPYLVYFAHEVVYDETEPLCYGGNLEASNPNPVTYGAYTFSGNYTAGMSMDGKYGVATVEGVQKLRIGGAKATLPAGCAYFTTNNNANGMLIRLDGGNVTGILDVNTGVVVENTAVYNLQGVKVSNNGTAGLPAGIYVMGGKKVIVK